MINDINKCGFLLTENKIKKSTKIENEMEKLKQKKREGKMIPMDIKHLIDLAYRRQPEAITEDIVDIFEIIRMALTVGIPFLIHPALGLIAFITDRIISEKVNENHKVSVLNMYRTQLHYVEEELEKKNLDHDRKETLINMRFKLKQDIDKLENYFSEITAYKNEKEDEEKYKSKDEFDDDFNMDDDFKF